MVKCTRRDEEVIAKANLTKSLRKQADEENLPKKIMRGLIYDYGIVPNQEKTKKIYFDVIF